MPYVLGPVNDSSSLLSISVYVQREEWATKRQQCSNIRGRHANGDSHGLRVMSEALRLKADKGALLNLGQTDV